MKEKDSPHSSNKRVGACGWPQGIYLMEKYHDEEWGWPIKHDRKLFEFMVLESAQAGLSWLTILKKREGYKDAFVNFEPHLVALYGEREILKLLERPGIVRHRLKIEATINNAKKFLEIQEEFSTFNQYVWSFVSHKPLDGQRIREVDIPATTALSQKLATDLKKRGFKFLGPTTVYAYMQAVGMVNDHIETCFRYRELKHQLK